MIFKTAIAASALGTMMLPSSAIILFNNLTAEAADLQQKLASLRASHRCRGAKRWLSVRLKMIPFDLKLLRGDA